MTARLRIRTNDLDAFLTSPEHRCGLNGYIDAPFLGGGEMLTTGGSFQLFVNDRSDGLTVPSRVITAHKKMIYSIQFTADDGVSYVLEGKKLINDETGLAVWRDTTTLFIQIYEVRGNGKLQFYGSGILRVLLLDFLKELMTFKVDTVGDRCEKAAALMRFGTFFFGQAWDVYARWILDYAPV